MKNKASAISFLGILILFLCFMLFDGLSMAQKTEEKAKKKLYISAIKANGVPAATANRVKEGIRLAIFEGFGARYQVLDDDSIKVMYKQAESIMASGCSDTSCITQIADGINADEIFYGEVLQEGRKIAISITSLERKGVSLGTKSIVKIAFLESQLDWFTSETAKKLINPLYKIDPSKAPRLVEEIKIGGIEIKSVQKLDIAVIQFKTSDESIERIIAVLKKNLGEADAIYAKNDFIKARVRYEEIINDIKERLRPEQQEKVKDFLEGIVKRMDTALVMQYKPDIDKADAWIKEKKELEEDDMRKAIKNYDSLEKDILKITATNKGARSQLFRAIKERTDNLHIALLSQYEKRGDSAYHDYKFDSAMENYETAQGELRYIALEKHKSANKERISEKIKTTLKTGRSYMENRVKSLADQAEYLYFDKQESDAKSAMKETRKFITGPMKIFATWVAIGYYNGMAEMMKIGRLTSDDLPDFFAAVEAEKQRIEEHQKKLAAMEKEKAVIEKQKAAQERFKRTGVYSIGDLGPAGGWIFYDKGSYSNGWRYLEAAPEDQSTGGAVWGCERKQLGTQSTDIGTGKSNTQIIVNRCEKAGIAAKLCAAYRGGGKSDWFLPSKDELDLMYTNLKKNGVGGFADDYYWGSSESDASGAWSQYFGHGHQYYCKKEWSTYSVRAVRAF